MSFWTALTNRTRALVLSFAERVGWVRKHELLAVQEKLKAAETQNSALRLSHAKAEAAGRNHLHDLELARVRIVSQEETLAEQQQKFAALGDEAKAIAAKVLELEQQRRRQEQLAVERAAQSAAQTEKLHAFRAKVAGQETLLAEKEAQLSTQGEKLHAFRTKVAGQETLLAEKEAQLSTQGEKLHAFRTKVAGQEAFLAEKAAELATQGEKLGAFRAKVTDLQAKMTEQAKLLAAAASREEDARQREQHLVSAMRSRELTAAQNLATMRASLARLRREDDPQNLALEEAALLAEIGRLHAIAEQKRQTAHRSYRPEMALAELRAGRMSVVPVSLEHLLDGVAAKRVALLSASSPPPVAATEAAEKLSASVLSLGSTDVANADPFDLVLMSFGLEDVADPMAALARAGELTAGGGRLAILGPLWSDKPDTAKNSLAGAAQDDSESVARMDLVALLVAWTYGYCRA